MRIVPDSPLRVLVFFLAVFSGCVDTSKVTAFTCDDAGVCQAGPISPDGVKNDSKCNNLTCSGCCVNGDCQPGTSQLACGKSGSACTDCGATQGCVEGVCTPRTVNGGTCAQSTDCASGVCSGGVCCDRACDGACESCALAGAAGKCTPKDESTPSPACGSFTCNGIDRQCPGSCTSSRQCAKGLYCDTGKCIPLKVQGTCSQNGECASGFCADGVCCDKACTGSCDACDLPGKDGQCLPIPSGSLGAPSCAPLTCNGTLADCPVLCSSGCPSTTFCSGEYCSAKRPAGTVCSAANQCVSGFCNDGVCCDKACDGACDACSVAAGAQSDGVCNVVGATRVCRGAASNCDVAERCDGASASCGADAFAASGLECAQATVTAWSVCTSSSTCSNTGSQSRTKTTSSCNGSGACVAQNANESAACALSSDGTSCGASSAGAWGACSYAATCATSGSRSRTVTTPTCAGGSCGSAQSTETDTSGCNRGTQGTSCGDPMFGAWSACSYAAACANSGSRTRAVTSYACGADGSCQAVSSTETDTSGCGRNVDGSECATTTFGAWGACQNDVVCDQSGTQTRTKTVSTCGGGTCNAANSTESMACTRATDGVQCASSMCGSCGACTADCERFQTCTSYACAAGSCKSTSQLTECAPGGCRGCTPR
jgi:hypothetical protein